MERVYEELDEAKAEIEKLTEECKRKSESCESLKRSHNDQLIKAQESRSRIENQAREINEKAEEISELKQISEDLRRSLNEKESIIKNLTAANSKLRADCDAKCKKLEEEISGLVSAVEEAKASSFEQEQRVRAHEEEIRTLKRSLSASQKKCCEAEKLANRSQEDRERDDSVLRLEEGKRKVEDELKWKNERFCHLEEAHQKLKDRFKASQEAWESDKSSLLDEIGSLQTGLDSRTRMCEELQSRLGICSQALAREETWRKSLQAQLDEVQARFEGVFGHYEDAESRLGSLTEYRTRQTEQENAELRNFLRESRKSQIQKGSGSGPGSVSKLQKRLKRSEAKEAELNSQLEKATRELESKDGMINELRIGLEETSAKLARKKSELESRDLIIEELRMALERIHIDSTANLEARAEATTADLKNKDGIITDLEAELDRLREECSARNSQLENAANDLSNYRSLLEQSEAREAESKSRELERQIEDYYLANIGLKLENEELSVALLVMKNEISDARSKIGHEKAEMGAEIERLRSSLSREIEERIVESSMLEVYLREQFRHNEAESRKRLESVCSELERANTELAEKICEGNWTEFELYLWKSVAESFRAGLEEGFGTRKELEASLLAQVVVSETIEREKQRLVEEIRDLQTRERESLLARELEQFLLAKIGEERIQEWKKIAVEADEKLKLAQQATSDSERKATEIEAKLESADSLIEELERERRNLVGNVAELKLAQQATSDSKRELNSNTPIEEVERERRNLVKMSGLIGQLDDRIFEFSRQDRELMGMLENIMAGFSRENRGSNKPEKENSDSPAAKKLGPSPDLRSPFRDINN